MKFTYSSELSSHVKKFIEKHAVVLLIGILSLISVAFFIFYYVNGLGLAYNDARSHLNIGRRVVEGLKPGFAQLGGVWLPLPHILMLPTIWNDFMWHSGLSGAIQSMVSYVATGTLIYLFLKRLHVGLFGRIAGVSVFALNINILYMQSTAMTELLLLATMTAGCYELIMWHKEQTNIRLVKTAFWIMLATLIRYDGWFLFGIATLLILFHTLRKYGYKTAEGIVFLFCTLGGLGIILWFVWNQAIFKEALYFSVGPYSAKAQQLRLEEIGRLLTKHNIVLSVSGYIAAFIYTTSLFTTIVSFFGAILLWFDKKIERAVRIALLVLVTPLIFNVFALYMGHSALFIPGITSDMWFNVRYGLMMVPTIAIFFGYFIHRLKSLRWIILGIFLLISFVSIIKQDSVVIYDGTVGSSGYDLREVTAWFGKNVINQEGYVLVSLASHDQAVFSSGLPMSRFVHEGTGDYWDLVLAHPERYVRWIIMRSNDDYDIIYKTLTQQSSFKDYYAKVGTFPYTDVYELKPQYLPFLRPLPKLEQ